MPQRDQRPGVHQNGGIRNLNNNNVVTTSNSNSKSKASLRKIWIKMETNDMRGGQLSADKSKAGKIEEK